MVLRIGWQNNICKSARSLRKVSPFFRPEQGWLKIYQLEFLPEKSYNQRFALLIMLLLLSEAYLLTIMSACLLVGWSLGWLVLSFWLGSSVCHNFGKSESFSSRLLSEHLWTCLQQGQLCQTTQSSFGCFIFQMNEKTVIEMSISIRKSSYI